MAARVLTDEEYGILVKKLGGVVSPSTVSQCKQAHRLLAEGRQPEDLTPAEQAFAKAFDGATLVQIPNDYGWEPGVEVSDDAPEPKPKKSKKDNGQ